MLSDSFTFDKLFNSHKRCRLNKQHKKDVISFELNLSQNLVSTSHKLLTQTFNLGKYKQFYIYEPKKRNIEALSYKDRVVLMAFCTNVLEEKIEKKLIYDNVACRKGKGTLFGLDRLQSFLRKFWNINKSNHGYFLKCDIKKYFQNIDHSVLKNLLNKVNFDEQDKWFINLLIDSKYKEENVGLPIGNQTSQWFALFYLNPVDRLIKEKLHIKYYVRYMDDMILVHKDKEYLKKCRQKIEQVCNEVLHLSLNSKTQIGKLSSGIDFLGFRTILCDNGKIIRLLRSSAKQRLRKNLKILANLRDNNQINQKSIEARLNAYQAHISHSNARKIYYLYKKHYNF